MANPYIMLVDDEEGFVETMLKRLKQRDLHTLAAYNGQEAVEELQNNLNLDVIILDVKMPGMDGVETLKKIKEIAPLVEVIMLTGHATVESAVEGMKLGAFDYLMKPCEIEDLMETINAAARKKWEHEQKIKDRAIENALSTYSTRSS